MTTSMGGSSASATSSVLGVPEQIAAEALLLELLRDPEVAEIQGRLKAELATLERGRTRDGAATLDRAIAMWTNSLIFAQIVDSQPTATILWSTDDTPRSWFGRTVGGLGVCGDNPDAIYRSARLEGGARYEVVGRFDPSNRPAQLVVEQTSGTPGEPPKASLSANQADMGTQIRMITDRDLDISVDGHFRIPITSDGPGALLFRDMLTDWRQRPPALSIRRLDTASPRPVDLEGVRQRVRARLAAFVRYWANYPDGYLGGILPNTVATPVVRDRGWGFIVGLRYRLAPDEAILVVTSDGNSAYTGSQITDLWMMTADVRRFQNCLNPSQITPDADGRISYVLSPTDPGVANWLDTADSSEGYGLFRWQGCPPGTTHQQLLLDFKVVKLADIAAIEGLARVTPEQRRAQLAARQDSFDSRLR